MRQSFLEVSLEDFRHNIIEVKKYFGKEIKIMPVIKANAYGTYINKTELIDEFDIVAVAFVDEAKALRKQGYSKEIFVLNQPDIIEIEDIITNDLTIGISSLEFLEELNNIKTTIKVHIELETGMGRTGVKLADLEDIICKIKLNSNIKVEGAYTHLSSADIDYEYTKNQLKIFEEGVNKIQNNFDIKYIHSLASNGILNFKNSFCNLIRPGIIIYGYETDEETLKKINIKPIAKLKTRINYIKEVEEGTSISYSRKFITKRKSRIATVPIGYADGIPRAMSNNGYVVINGKKAPIIGNICMDSFMIDITDINTSVKVGDFVYIWDNDIIKLEEVAKNCSTINYEIISRISDRVQRIMI